MTINEERCADWNGAHKTSNLAILRCSMRYFCIERIKEFATHENFCTFLIIRNDSFHLQLFSALRLKCDLKCKQSLWTLNALKIFSRFFQMVFFPRNLPIRSMSFVAQIQNLYCAFSNSKFIAICARASISIIKTFFMRKKNHEALSMWLGVGSLECGIGARSHWRKIIMMIMMRYHFRWSQYVNVNGIELNSRKAWA